MRKTILLVLSIYFSVVSIVSAQQKTDSLSVNLSDLEVNANRNKLYSEMGRVLTIIDKSEIQQLPVQSLDQLLDYVAGIDIRQRGVNGTQADISVRGGSFDQVLVLLNGVNITDPQTGHFNLDVPLNLSDVSRVEILEGSSARVLGPNAFSGAINIVTDNQDNKALNAEFSGGSFNTFGESVSGNLGTDNWRNFASVSHKSSSGYMFNTDFDMSSAFFQSVLNTKSAGIFNFQLAGQLKDMGENGFYSLKYPNQREANKELFSALDWTLNTGHFSWNAQASWKNHYDRYELDYNYLNGFKYHLTDVSGGKIGGTYKSKFGKTSVGFQLRNEHIFSNSLGLPMSSPDSIANPFETNIYFNRQYNRTIYTGLVDHSLTIGNWYISAGIATSYCSDFKFSTYGGLDLGYSVNDNVKLYLSANSATRLPTFTDLFFSNPVQQGNPLLKPEQSKTVEIGTKILQSNWDLNADIYYRQGENIIDWVKLTATSPKYETMNLSNVNALGGDFSFDYHFTHSFLKKASLSYSYLNMLKATPVFDSKYALDYLRNKIQVTIDHSLFSDFSVSWSYSYSDRAGTYDANAIIGKPTNLVTYVPYSLLNTRISWTQKKYILYAEINNILNTKYADYGGLTQPGINFNVGFRLKLR